MDFICHETTIYSHTIKYHLFANLKIFCSYFIKLVNVKVIQI